MASSNSIYLKRGNKTREERKYVEELVKFLNDNPDKQFKPVKTFGALKKAWQEHCVQDTEFVESPADTATNGRITVEKPEPAHELSDEEYDDAVDKILNGSDSNGEEYEDAPNPFEKENPIVRDYVNDDKFSQTNDYNNNNTGQTDFSEPTDFKSAFELPNNDNAGSEYGGPQQGQAKKQQPPKQDPVNPAFDEMKNANKGKSSKRFARYIVETVCLLAEKGFVWYANKDINEAKLAEYEVSGEVDLSILLTLPDNSKATVKEFFLAQCLQAEQLAKIDPTEKEDLITALATVLLEKGIAPTPTQELILISLKIFGGQAITLLALKSSTNSVLDQLRVMKKQETEEQDAYNEAALRKEQAEREKHEAELKQRDAIKKQSEGAPIVNPLKEEGDFSVSANVETKE